MSVIENNFGSFESSRESPVANAWSQQAFSEILSDRMYSTSSRKVEDPNWLSNLVLEDSATTNGVAQAETTPSEAPSEEPNDAPSEEPRTVPPANESGSSESNDGPKVAYAVRPANGEPRVVEGAPSFGTGDARNRGTGHYSPPDSGSFPKTLPGSSETAGLSDKIPFDLEPGESPKAKLFSERIKNAMDQVQQRHVAAEGSFGKVFNLPTEEERQAREIEKIKHALAEVAKRRPPHDPSEPIKESPFKPRVPAENPNPGTDTPPEEPPVETKPPIQPPGYENGTPILNG